MEEIMQSILEEEKNEHGGQTLEAEQTFICLCSSN